ncbi:MAG TPA: nucleotidyltransferase domain-containing protein [Armatimonadota bacterium]|nr:nucleotidyltransferase domain-containing protein [Armatimonadota bacterium]
MIDLTDFRPTREDRARQRDKPLLFDVTAARERLALFFASRPEARVAFLFGSRAHGKLRPSSDVDIAIWMDPSLSDECRALLGLDWMGRLPDALGYAGDLDLLVLNDAPLPLAWDVVHAPVILYETEPEAGLAVAAHLRRSYRDELPRLQRQRNRLYDQIRRGELGVCRKSH